MSENVATKPKKKLAQRTSTQFKYSLLTKKLQFARVFAKFTNVKFIHLNKKQTQLEGRITKSTGSWYTVRTDDGARYQCRMKGKIRRTTTLNATNPIAVGDWVSFEWDEQLQSATINEIHDRKNYIIRRATNLSKQVHVLAANLDQAFLITSIHKPNVPLRFIDRFLVTAEAYGVPCTLVLNKVDLIFAEETDPPTPQYEELMNKYDDFVAIYEQIGYTVLQTSIQLPESLDPLKEEMQDKINLFAGFSGGGKSSIINAIAPDLDLKTGAVSQASNKGKHTTTFAEMHEVNPNTFLIDTPGIKGLGLINIEKHELSHFFPEMRAILHQCKFHNCLHVDEPQCAVRNALEDGTVSYQRYESYVMMLDNNEEAYR